MFDASQYVIYMRSLGFLTDDTVETGREKINFLLTGDTSPFKLWSGTPQFLNYESIYRIDESDSNYIDYTTDSSSGSSPFSLILNGSGNTISSSGASDFYAGFNLIDGIDNKITNSSGTTIFGSGNTYIGLGDGEGLSFIHGVNNSHYFNSGGFPISESSLTISSQNNINNSFLYSTFLSSDNSYFGGGLFQGDFNFISGSKNKTLNQVNALFGASFIGNGSGNTIINTNTSLNFTNSSIINGHDNNINADGINVFDVNLFGSNLTAINNNYSHFENLYVDGGLYTTSPIMTSLTSSFEYVIDGSKSFYEIQLGLSSNLFLKFLNGTINFQTVSIVISCFSTMHIYFGDSTFTTNTDFSTRTPNNISAKKGAGVGGSTNIYSTTTSQDYIAFFFMWLGVVNGITINKWVMYTSDTGANATF